MRVSTNDGESYGNPVRVVGEKGNKGDYKQLKNSKLSELRFHFGSGYRIYFKEL